MTGAPTITPITSDASADCAADDIKRVEAVFALVDSRGGGVEELARAAGVTIEAAQAIVSDPANVERFMEAQRKAEDSGVLLKPVAARLTLDMLHKLAGELEAGGLDADDIANLLPKVHKVVEHADRMEAARGDGYDGLTTFNIVFLNGSITATEVRPATETIDIDAAEVQDD